MCVLFFFFFKQKTAYEMRISDWSSDGALPICGGRRHPGSPGIERAGASGAGGAGRAARRAERNAARQGPHRPCRQRAGLRPCISVPRGEWRHRPIAGDDRKGGVKGKVVAGRVESGGRRTLTKKNNI